MRKAIDSYILTAIALRNLKQYQSTVDLELLVKGLVSTSQALYINGSIKYLNSCISSMFVSSVGHFTQMYQTPQKYQEQLEKLKIVKLKDLN